jgi:hypothetical protein
MLNNTDQTPTPEIFDPITKAAERLLSDLYGFAISFTEVQRLSESSGRNLILRCSSAPTHNVPSRFIIKKVKGDSSSWDSQRFFNDWVGSQFLSSLGGGAKHSPHFYGGHRNLGFIVLEDLGERSLLEPLLHENAVSAEAALLRFSTRLGQLHAETVNRHGVYEQLLHSVSSVNHWLPEGEQKINENVEKVKLRLEGLSVPTESAFFQEIQEIVSVVSNPGPFLVYIHGDPCPTNAFDNREQLRLIDFELGHFGHALIDATYARMLFPTSGYANRLPRSLVEQMENRYRMELIQGCPQAQEDRVFEEHLVKICGFWLLNLLNYVVELVLVEDLNWGITSLRPRVLAGLEAFITTSEKFGYCPAVRATAERLLALLSERWTETHSLPLYPAFNNE